MTHGASCRRTSYDKHFAIDGGVQVRGAILVTRLRCITPETGRRRPPLVVVVAVQLVFFDNPVAPRNVCYGTCSAEVSTWTPAGSTTPTRPSPCEYSSFCFAFRDWSVSAVVFSDLGISIVGGWSQRENLEFAINIPSSANWEFRA